MIRTIMALPLLICTFLVSPAQMDNHSTESRRYNNFNYKILDQEGFIIYSRSVHVTGSKATVTEKKFYFSKDKNSDIKPLTINNLKHAFPSNRKFHELIDLYFRNSDELTRYDSFYKEYKLKALFRKAFNG